MAFATDLTVTEHRSEDQYRAPGRRCHVGQGTDEDVAGRHLTDGVLQARS
ncbi:hypothetical protein SCNU_19757 [Gordonia neofelifaecis NRRL B-59395]|uniref:Uncharacterized protein n=1 Tax=Gordonia neofelifaecis NRRL B-59395 TaxID=644548 RepID=F1YPV8_9ACTN|nr:hypothetical protein SCNU_19757 [Gordonia neofelifaecis NRRL B-59395]